MAFNNRTKVIIVTTKYGGRGGGWLVVVFKNLHAFLLASNTTQWRLKIFRGFVRQGIIKRYTLKAKKWSLIICRNIKAVQ